MPPKPRVVIVGAGMAGLAAAHRLHQACRHSLDLTVLEGSNRLGGRIQTAHIGGDQVELGATLIHGITGSPIYKIAQRIGALSADLPCENYQNRLNNTRFRAEGARVPVDPQLIHPAIDAFRSCMALVKGQDVQQPLSSADGSVGAFLREQFRIFSLDREHLQKTENIETAKEGHAMGLIAEDSENLSAPKSQRDYQLNMRNKQECTPGQFQENEGAAGAERRSCEEVSAGSGFWSPLLLQESAFLSFESLERNMSACSSLDDLDLASYKEYAELPGAHITIGKGYVSVLNELENSLPVGTVKFKKKVRKIFWNHSHPPSGAPIVLLCEDGSLVEADHAILTVSLGVLKAGISNCEEQNASHICRSVTDLRGWKASEEVNGNELFEPSLPNCKLKAISRLGFGLVNKLFLLLDSAADKSLFTTITFLHQKGSKQLPSWLRRAFGMLPIYKGSNVIVIWLSGEEALQMEALTDEEVLDGIAELLAAFKLADFQDKNAKMNGNNAVEFKQRLRAMFKGVLRSRWATNSLCKGSYSFVALGSSGEDIDILAKPLPEESEGERVSSDKLNASNHGHFTESSPMQLLFAGEATHRNYYSTTHGAFLSGVREADRLIDHFKKNSVLG